jgi:hypothetical protein
MNDQIPYVSAPTRRQTQDTPLGIKGVSAENMLFPCRNKSLALNQRNNMSVATAIGAKEAAKRASNRKGGFGVSVRYIRQEIERGNLKAELVTPIVGKPYYIIEEKDFEAWEDRRRRTGE